MIIPQNQWRKGMTLTMFWDGKLQNTKATFVSWGKTRQLVRVRTQHGSIHEGSVDDWRALDTPANRHVPDNG